jgi:5S rRNA maturation endonuclease (ribonuclease M5)
MLTIDLFEELQGPPEPTLIDVLRDFLPIAVKHLKIEKLPKIKLLRDVETEHMPSFGKFSNEDRTVHVDVQNRHPNDVLRTLAHELTHYAQGEQDRLDADSWQTGSTIEDEANAEAGVIMREFNQQFPQYMELKPIVFEKWSQKYKKSINCSNPKGFSQKAHCAGRKKANEAEDLNEYKKNKPVIIYTNPDYRGATIGAGVKEQLPVTKLPFAQLVMWEDSKSLRSPKIRSWVKDTLIPKLQKGTKLKPLLVWSNKGRYYVIDGNHRYLAYKAVKFQGDVPVRIVPNNMVTVTNKIPVEESAKTPNKVITSDGITVKFFDNVKAFYKSHELIWAKEGDYSNPTEHDIHVAKITTSRLAADMGRKKIGMDENFADGKGPGRAGDSQRHGIPKGATMAQLEKAAKAPGRKGQLARWQINMRRGRKK